MLKQICYKERSSHHWYLSKAVLILKLEIEVGLNRLFYFVIKTFGMGNNLYFFLNTWEVMYKILYSGYSFYLDGFSYVISGQ